MAAVSPTRARRKRPAPHSNCSACYAPIPLGDVRCAKHHDWVSPVDKRHEADVPKLSDCPSCGRATFRVDTPCSRCEPARAPEKLVSERDKLRTRSYRKRMRPAKPKPPPPPEPERPNGLKLDPDEPHVEREKSAWSVGNRCYPGVSVSEQAPAREKALQLMDVPGEWEVLAFYQHPRRIKAAVWYLRHRVAPTMPDGTWEFRRCWWEHAAVMGRYTPPS